MTKKLTISIERPFRNLEDGRSVYEIQIAREDNDEPQEQDLKTNVRVYAGGVKMQAFAKNQTRITRDSPHCAHDKVGGMEMEEVQVAAIALEMFDKVISDTTFDVEDDRVLRSLSASDFKPMNKVYVTPDAFDESTSGAKNGVVSSVLENTVFVKLDEDVARVGLENAVSVACHPISLRKL